MDNLLTVFSPVAMMVVKEATGVPGCMGLELGLTLGLFFIIASPGFEGTIGVKGWPGFDLLGDVVTALAFIDGDVAIGAPFDAVVATAALFVGVVAIEALFDDVVTTGLAFVVVAT